jgi:hypothetical protein
MTITAICGDIGSGKSLKQLEYGLQQCNRKRKRLVTNFGLNMKELRKYAALKKYGWLAHIIDTKQICIVDAAENIADILTVPNSITLLDEAGIFLNTREFQKTPKRLLMDLAQSRKSGTDLIYASQFDEQVDRQFRMLTQYFIHAAGASVYDKAMRRPKLIWRCYFHFTSGSYHAWNSDIKSKSSFIRTYFKYAYDTELGIVKPEHYQLFKCFDSFARLEQQASAVAQISTDYIEPNYTEALHHSRLAAIKRDSKKVMGFTFPPGYVHALNRPKQPVTS